MNAKARAAIEGVAIKHGLSVETLMNKSVRPRFIAKARHEAFYQLREVLRREAVNPDAYSYVNIGKMFDGMDHSTVIHGVRRHRERMEAGEVT